LDRFAEALGGAHYPGPNVDPAFGQFVMFMRQCRHRALLHIKAFCPTAATYRVENGWIWNGEFNAAAGIDEVDGIDCVGINVGIAYIICNLFRAMLGHQEILTRVGDCKREEKRTYDLETTAVDLANFIPLKFPIDPRRARYCFQLSYCAFHFIFLHEFGHLFHGHVDWLCRNVGFARLDEIGAASIPGLKPINLQTIEMDADAFGVTDLLIAALGVSYDPTDRSNPPRIPETHVFGTRREAIFTVLFAIYSVFRVFGKENLADDAVFSADHPPAIYRQRFALGSMIELVQDLDVIPMQDFGHVVTEAVVEVEEAFSHLMGTSVLQAPQVREGFERGRQLLNQLLENWKKLKPELELLKRGGDLRRG
jgi:hypothetical protein